ncbi:cysteine desulfurase [Brevibacterium casei]|uniref:cysteine desulfurase n=1 Tax=Brevibacterium casei TaxID=33889 RepID=A0A269ZAZ8_9MICO|nr:cysteine desulfurase family protein [Brevibacterium casei]MCT1766885.1 cysteine desulfurase [Brevibacterium casei]MCT2183331.1 cysteine desulfurase [Brevibacterium casei]PAK94954.1 cysteine desulfurase [Brevibacterium casei]QPS35648.1 cysteine desulfurase [Brevibacterium casei]VEW14017.1 Cysteine desulfurase [Brevibacterium casei]
MGPLYLDTASSAPVRREALEAAWPYLSGAFGNPSSHHEFGRVSAEALEDARARVARVLGMRSTDIVFTGGGTEAANLAVTGMALGGLPDATASAGMDTGRRHLVTSPLEHEAVLASADFLARRHGFDVAYVEVDPDGTITPEALRAVLREDTAVVSLGYANNEIGTVADIAALSEVAHAAGAHVHTDAVQAAGWLPLAGLGVDAITLAGHKVGAPKGIGVAAIRARIPIEPIIHGGGQESGRRSGTENVALAVAFATALELAESERAEAAARVAGIRGDFIAEVLRSVDGALLTGSAESRTPNHASFCFSRTSGEAVLLELERLGVTASSGSACAVGSDEPSHVLLALGIDAEVAKTSVRFTFPSAITAEQGSAAAAAVVEAANRLSLAYS